MRRACPLCSGPTAPGRSLRPPPQAAAQPGWLAGFSEQAAQVLGLKQHGAFVWGAFQGWSPSH